MQTDEQKNVFEKVIEQHRGILFKVAKNFHHLLPMIFVLVCAQACHTQRRNSKPILSNFKVVLPFQTDNRGISIETSFDQDTSVFLIWDNHSPSWLKSDLINSMPSLKVKPSKVYRTKTADGKHIHGKVYECTKFRLGPIGFQNTEFYGISEDYNGVVGENLISSLVWEINFKDHVIIMASSIDSLIDKGRSEKMPAKFLDDIISISIQFRNKVSISLDVDFGFNGGILLPTESFNAISPENSKIYKRELTFATPGHRETLSTLNGFDTVSLGGQKLPTLISSNKIASEKLIGLAFFQQFDFVILDYINKELYVGKKITNLDH